MGIKSLVGKKISKMVKFMDTDIEINKLSISEVLLIQEKAKNIDENEKEGFDILKTVIRSSVPDAKDLSDVEFDGFPLDELSQLSNEIMRFSGISGEQAGK